MYFSMPSAPSRCDTCAIELVNFMQGDCRMPDGPPWVKQCEKCWFEDDCRDYAAYLNRWFGRDLDPVIVSHIAGYAVNSWWGTLLILSRPRPEADESESDNEEGPFFGCCCNECEEEWFVHGWWCPSYDPTWWNEASRDAGRFIP